LNILFTKVETEDRFEASELRTRARESTKSKKTTHYRVLADDVEVAFVSLDRWPEPDVSQMVVCEIFIPRDLRRKGIGAIILDEIEKVAIKEGFKKVHLRPWPLDSELMQTKLNAWYLNKGYKWHPIITSDMEKDIT
jgi:GNAT superfamily N-acetyltransferase